MPSFASDRLQLQGFARVVGGFLDDPEHTFEEYDNQYPRFGQQTLIAIQPTYRFNDQLSITSQLVAHSSKYRKSGAEWLYLTWQPSDQWQLRVGQLRMPFFNFSDSIDVGYSYPWITPPVQLYNNFLFPTFKGASASHIWANSEWVVETEAVYGRFDGDVMMSGARVDVDTTVDHMSGINLKLSRGALNFRLAFNTGYNSNSIPSISGLRDALQQSGATESAATLAEEGRIHVYGAGFSYENLKSYYLAEWVKTETELPIAPRLSSYYLTAGRYLGEWSIHATFASSSYQDYAPSDELADALTNPQNPLMPLAVGYYQLYDNIPTGGLDSYTLGSRWDFRANMALKMDISYLEENHARSGFFDVPTQTVTPLGESSPTHSAMFYQIAWEWVF